MFAGSIVWKGIVYASLMVLGKGLVATVIYGEYLIRLWQSRKSSNSALAPGNRNRAEPETIPNERLEISHSLALLVGFAMVARGEIGFLIASLSQSSGTLTLREQSQLTTEPSGEAIFLVIIWAVVLCTIIGKQRHIPRIKNSSAKVLQSGAIHVPPSTRGHLENKKLPNFLYSNFRDA